MSLYWRDFLLLILIIPDPMDRKRQTLSNSQSQVNVDLPVNTNRYTEKVKSLGQKTFSFAALPREE